MQNIYFQYLFGASYLDKNKNTILVYVLISFLFNKSPG